MFGKRKVATLVAEFLGTGVLTFLILSVQRSTIGVPFFVAAAAGLTLALLVFTMGASSGGYFNPALTVGFWTTRKLSTITSIMYIAVQLFGAWAAYGLYTYFVKNTLAPVGGHYTTRILVAEAVGSGLFGFGVAAAVYQRAVSQAAKAAFVGLALMLGIVAASPAAIGLLNPAVALGVRAWVWGTYVLGPVIGAVIGINLYYYLFTDEKAITFSASPAKAAVVARPVAKKKTASRSKKK